MCDVCSDLEYPCCNEGICIAIPSLSICDCCGASMFQENGLWFHHSQEDIEIDYRMPHGSL